MHYKLLLSGLVLASLTACSTLSPIRDLPPSALLQDCDTPTLTARTNEALAQLALDQKQSLRRCNADKAALREWAK